MKNMYKLLSALGMTLLLSACMPATDETADDAMMDDGAMMEDDAMMDDGAMEDDAALDVGVDTTVEAE